MGEIMNLIEELNRKIDALVKQNEELKLKNAKLELQNNGLKEMFDEEHAEVLRLAHILDENGISY